MIGCVILCHHQDPGPMLQATAVYGDRSVLVVDRSPEIVVTDVRVIRNDTGEGFLAGAMRNLGASYLHSIFPDLAGIVFFDGDRIPNITPLNFSGDCVLYMGDVDPAREALPDDITEQCRHPYSPFYSAGVYLSRIVLDLLGWQPFDPDFSGIWGWEDSFLGDVVVSMGFRVLLDKELRVSGEISEPSWVRDTKNLNDTKFRNWHLRLAKRKHLNGLIQESQMSENQKQKIAVIPAGKLNTLVDMICSLPYRQAQPMVRLLEESVTLQDIDVGGSAEAPTQTGDGDARGD